jgi:hypothetical protein
MKTKAKKEKPYIVKKVVVREELRSYNPKYGDDRVCRCGHSYYRHFDSYDNMEPVGCKYCHCFDFKEAPPMPKSMLKSGMSEADALNAYHKQLEEKYNAEMKKIYETSKQK